MTANRFERVEKDPQTGKVPLPPPLSPKSEAPSGWIVHKFGGTSVANADRYLTVAELMSKSVSPRTAVVVSAMSGVTNSLIELVQCAARRDNGYRSQLAALGDKHLKTAVELLGTERAQALVKIFENDFRDLEDLLRGIWLARSASDRTIELVSGYGEIWSAQLLDAQLRAKGKNSTWLDARQVLVVEPAPLTVTVQWEESRAKISRWLTQHQESFVVITGFVASTREDLATTLGRNGSDYSASIFGALLEASAIHIWTDVDGVLSADPRLVPEAVVLGELSYHEATELAYFGAKVVHPSTMAPAIQGRIPIWIRNTFNPENPGTQIHADASSDAAVKGFATIDHMALVNVEGTGMMGVPGVANRVFGALREVGVSVVMISQASSESSICFVIPDAQAETAKTRLEREFFAELTHGQIQAVSITAHCSILAVVGDNMVQKPGIAGKFFRALGKAGVNIGAIAQGSSERNISAVIDGKDACKGLRAVHSAFYLSNQTLSLGIVGAGLIGGTFLDQLAREAERLRREEKIDLRVRGILTGKKMLLGDPQIDLTQWRQNFAKTTTPPDLETFIRHVHVDYLPHTVIVDATASADLPAFYPGWLQQGLHLVTPNKKGFSGSFSSYRALKGISQNDGRHCLYSTTVGAGLPVINTLRDLVQTGDEVQRIEGILSGTLSYLFNSWTGEKRFSEQVQQAKQLGYTEPDPRDDLSGQDVARKLVILAREMGKEIELESIQVRDLVPPALRQGTVEEFLTRLPEFDPSMQSLREDAERQKQVIRYVGTIESDGKASIDLRPLALTHPFASLSASDNIVAFHTARYHSQPLIIRGPGAGPEVTAAGVFADLLRLAKSLGDSR